MLGCMGANVVPTAVVGNGPQDCERGPLVSLIWLFGEPTGKRAWARCANLCEAVLDLHTSHRFGRDPQ
jgi:hypothetical protein